VAWVCDVLLSEHSVRAYGRDLAHARQMRDLGVDPLSVNADYIKLYIGGLKGLRDFALIATFFITGCRVSALIAACVGHLEFDGAEHYLQVTEKRNKKSRKIGQRPQHNSDTGKALLSAVDFGRGLRAVVTRRGGQVTTGHVPETRAGTWYSACLSVARVLQPRASLPRLPFPLATDVCPVYRLLIMAKKKQTRLTTAKRKIPLPGYDVALDQITDLLETARRASVRSVNTIMAVTYWEIGRRIVELEQSGKQRAEYGKALLKRLSADLTERFGRGFSRANLEYMRRFYQGWPIPQTVSGKSCKAEKTEVLSAFSGEAQSLFPLPWSHYVRLLSVKKKEARKFYEHEAVRGGWSIRQLDRQIASQFYERTVLSRNKTTVLGRGRKARLADAVVPEEEIKDPFVLEFLDLKDEYSESDLDEALIRKLESFLLELGGDFTFVGRQRRLRIGDEWYRIDLLFFHRGLRCLIIIDLKLGKFTHADAGQMHLYLNYAREHWTLPDENPPVGLILCASKDAMLAKYALEGLPNKVVAAEYRTALPEEEIIAAELEQTRRLLESRSLATRRKPQK
jgi:predicted nuclease of restriction endonuclease-like (RecB) superfamily